MRINKLNQTNFGAFVRSSAIDLMYKDSKYFMPDELELRKKIIFEASKNQTAHVMEKDGRWIVVEKSKKDERDENGKLKLVPVYSVSPSLSPFEAIERAQEYANRIEKKEFYSMSTKEILDKYTV